MSKISLYNEQTTLHNSDLGVGVDTTDTTQSASGTTKKWTWTTAKSFLKTYFDTLYFSLTNLDTDGTLTSNSDTKVASQKAVKTYVDAQGGDTAAPNLLKNGNFINNSTNGYGSTPDDWVSSNANPVQGGIPTLTKQELIDGLGISDGDIEILLNLNGNLNDISSNGYNLTAGASAPTDSSDGEMAQCKSFAMASSQYATNAAANCRVATSQTFIAFVNQASTTTTPSEMDFCGVGDSTPTNYVLLGASAGKYKFAVTGLTPNNLSSDVVENTSKWNMVVGIYDSSANKLKIWVNGIKKEVSVTGSHTAGTGGFSVGRIGDFNGQYANAKIQNVAMLSIALSDNQVKKLLAMTLYKGQKIRRATTNAIQYQDLPMDVVERLRGRTVALRADMYQAVASTGQISILQTLASGSTDETIISATDATTGSWLEKLATGTISATAVGIRIQLKHSTSDGNTWFENVSLYEGSTLLPYDHSKDDWSRFPRLLRMDIPLVISGYQFEEYRWLTMPTVSYGGGGSMTYSTVTTNFGKFMTVGQIGVLEIKATGTTGGSASNGIYFSSPYCPSAMVNSASSAAQVVDTGTILAGYSYVDTSVSPARHYCRKYDGSNFGLGTGRELRMTAISIEIS